MILCGVWYFDPPYDSGWLCWEGHHGRPQEMEFNTLEEATEVAERQAKHEPRCVFLPTERKKDMKEVSEEAIRIGLERRRKK